MYITFALGVTAFVLCLILTPLCRNLSLRFNIVDHPDDDRKLHPKPIPRVGGVPIVLAYTGALAVVFTLAPSTDRIYINHHGLLWSLLPAAGVVFLTGLLDDLLGLKPWQKLAGQLIGAGLAVGLGTHIMPGDLSLAGHQLLASPWVYVPLSLIWLVGCTNAVNLIDGLDGLAAGVGLFATVTTLLAAIFSGNTGLILATIPLAGCLLAFLCFNFSPASIFLGDCGSLTVGFMLGCFGLVWSQRSGTMLGMAAPLMALALPLIDVGLAICRRFLRRVPIFKGDRGHIHHMVLARGFKPRDTALILYGVCALAASLALLQSFGRYMHGIVIVVFLLLIWAGVNYLGYIELGAASRALSRQQILRMVRDEIYLHDLERSLSESNSADDYWQIVRKVCADMHFATVEMYFQDTHFEAAFEQVSAHLGWKITLPLGQYGYLTLRRAGHEKPPKLMMATLDRLQDSLAKNEHAPAERLSRARVPHNEPAYRITAASERP